MPPIKIFIIEDDDSLRDSLLGILTARGLPVEAWADAESFLATPLGDTPVVVLTDMRLPGDSGVALHARLQAAGTPAQVIYMSGESSLSEGIAAMKQGAIDFLLKPFSLDALLTALNRALEQARSTASHLEHTTERQRQLSQLSPRERAVLDLLVKGYNNNEITEALGISLPTAKQYKSEVFRKFGVSTLASLIRLNTPGQS